MSSASLVRRLLLPDFDLMRQQRRRLARRVPQDSSVLDAGCGDGGLSLLLARRGCCVVGVTNDARAAARLQNLPQRVGAPVFRLHDIAGDGPVAGEFDVAICFDVLEHIPDDGTAAANLAASLRPGGRLLVTVPNADAPPLWGDQVSDGSDGGHVRQGYTRDGLEALLAEAGLRVVSWCGFAGFFARTATSVSRRQEARRGRLALWLRTLWLVVLRPLCWLDPILPGARYGLFVVAEKPLDDSKTKDAS